MAGTVGDWMVELKAGVGIDPAPQEKFKKRWMKTEMMNEPSSFLRATWSLYPWQIGFVNLTLESLVFIHTLLYRHHCQLSSRGFWVAQYDNRGLGANRSYWGFSWFILHSASQRPGVMNMTVAPSERRTDSLAAKQALKSETVVGSRKREGRGRNENSISCLCHRNSSALVKTAALTRQWISFKCLCAKASKKNINTP